MGSLIVNRPEEGPLRQMLDAHLFDVPGTAIRLAWLAGLLRNEIAALEWDRVSFLNREIALPGRIVPMCEELSGYLAALSARQSWRFRRVLLSDHRRRPMQPQPVSAAVRAALDEAGQPRVRLLDLRYDFILRQLAEHDWQYVSRVTGVAALALRAHFSELLPDGAISMKIETRKSAPPDALALRMLLQDQGDSVAGRTLRLIWQAGLSVDDAAALRWEQVEETVLRTAAGPVPLSAELAAFLRPLRQADGQPVILSPRSRKAMLPDRLSRLARRALVGAGLDNVSLRDLQRDHAVRSGGEETLLRLARSRGSITRNNAADALGVPGAAASRRLLRLVERGHLIRVGARYYPADAVVSPERQAAVIRAYLEREGVAVRQDIAELLRIPPRQCSVILKRLVAQGLLRRDKQRYSLPPAK